MPLQTVLLDALTIDDERSVAHVALYHRLKDALRRSGHRFRVPAPGARVSWDRALFLNLTFWSDAEGADVLCDACIPADVVAHAAWHHVVGRRFAGAPSAEAMLFAEAIASAFDLYLVGRLLPNAPDSDFIATQVPILAECAEEAGLADEGFAALLEEVTRDPERAFEDLRALLFDVATALLACRDAVEAQATLEGFVGRRFEPLLHHYQLSNWILYARAYAPAASTGHGPDAAVRAADATLRAAPDALAWLDAHWLDAPA